MQTPAPGHIIQCADYGGPYSGSFVPMLAAAARAARARGFQTTMCFAEVARGRRWLEDLSDLAAIRFITPQGPRADLRQLRLIADEQPGSPTVIHSHFGTFDLPAALLVLRRRHTSVICHAHSDNPRPIRLRSRLYGAVVGRIVDATLCVSPDIHADLLARAFPPDRLIYVPNAVDIERFSLITPTERRAARDALNLPQDAKVVLHLGWDWARKGGDRFLAAAKLLADRADTVFMTVIGDSAFALAQDEICTATNVTSVSPRESINELYAAADVFLNCSRAEGMPYAVLEALARGLPVVATDLPVAHEVLDGLTAARIVPADPAQIAGALEGFLTLQDDERRGLAAAARAHVDAGYALEPWAESLVEIYAERIRSAR